MEFSEYQDRLVRQIIEGLRIPPGTPPTKETGMSIEFLRSFKVGDRVRCKKGRLDDSPLIEGMVYEVVAVFPGLGSTSHVRLKEIRNWQFLCERFEAEKERDALKVKIGSIKTLVNN